MAHARASTPTEAQLSEEPDKTGLTEGNDGNKDNVASEPSIPEQVNTVDTASPVAASSPQPTGRPGTPPLTTIHGPIKAPPTTILLQPSPGDRKRPPPDGHTTMAVEAPNGHDIPTGTPMSTTERATDISLDTTTQSAQHNPDPTAGTTQLLPVKCTICFKETLTTYQCDLCGKVLCLLCTTVTLDTELITCQNCTRPGASDTTSRSKESHSLTPSDSSEGSSFSQRSTKPNPRRRQVRAKLDTPSTTSRTAGKTNDTPLPKTSKTKATRHTVQTAIDTLLPPRGKEPAKGSSKMETRQTRTSTQDA